jgi:hypothetical protein
MIATQLQKIGVAFVLCACVAFVFNLYLSRSDRVLMDELSTQINALSENRLEDVPLWLEEAAEVSRSFDRVRASIDDPLSLRNLLRAVYLTFNFIGCGFLIVGTVRGRRVRLGKNA